MSATQTRSRRRVPRILLDRREAAESLGMSLRHFERHVQPHIDCVYSGNKRLYDPNDLEQWRDAAKEPAR